MAFTKKTKRIPSGWQSTLRNAQGGSKETMNTANTGNTVNGLWQPVCHALWNFDSTGLCVLLAGKAHCAMHRVRAENVGLVGLVGLVGRLAQDACEPCALKIPECMAHSAPCAACPPKPPAKEGPYQSVQVRTSPYSLAHSIGTAQSALPAFRRLERALPARRPHANVCRPPVSIFKKN